MEIIPAIDLLNGTCVRLNQGNYAKVTQFNSDPIAQALEWETKGAKRLHLVDLDGAKTGNPVNNDSIRDIARSIRIPIQIGGGVRSLERAEELLDYGVDKVILGTIAIEKPLIAEELANKYPGKIIIGIDAKNGKVATRGWITESDIRATDLAAQFSNPNFASIITTDISTDGTLNGPNLQSLKEVASSTNLPVIASGGIGSIADLLSLIPLEDYGVTGVIVGRALYDGKIDLNEAIKAMSKPRLEDHNQKENYFA